MTERFSKASIILRAVSVIGIVTALSGGATYAALQSQATLTNNTIASASANLQVSTDGGSTFGHSKPGFDFTGIVPGGANSGPKQFLLENLGSADMSLNLSVPTLPTFVVTPSGTVDPNQVHVLVSCTSHASGTLTANTTLAALQVGANLSGTLKHGDTVVCSATVSMDPGAFTGQSASSSHFDMVFTGTGV